MGLGATADFDRFEEAEEWFRARVTMNADEAKALESYARWRAWWVSDVAQARLVQDMQDSITKALGSGADYKTWQAEAVEQLENAWSLEGEAAAFRVETIWRNAAQNAYSRGRWQQLNKPTTRAVRPYWLYDAIIDGRNSEICKRCNNTVLPNDDPWWDAHTPPLHHRCRSTIRALRETEAKRRGISNGPPVDADGIEVDAQDGFGWSPEVQDLLEQPIDGLEGLDDDLAADVVRRYRRQRAELGDKDEANE